MVELRTRVAVVHEPRRVRYPVLPGRLPAAMSYRKTPTSEIAAPASMQHSILLDNWRGWAILLVLIGHFFETDGDSLGRLGVELFFVLSGRLMADLLFVKR